MTTGGRFDFDDGGTYCGCWEDGKAHGYGVCTGPKAQGEYAGAWHCGYEISGIYTWTSGNNYKGQWTQGKRHGVGVETKGRWIYRGEWTQGFKGRYGVRQSSTTGATYEGTWTTGLQDGYGVETYADGGTYQGQWLRGIRHGYGVRQSVPYGLAAYCRQKSNMRESLTSLRSEQEDDQVIKDRDRKMDEARGGFVLTGSGYGPGRGPGDTDTLTRRPPGSAGSGSSTRGASIRNKIVDGLRLRKQRSTGDIQESTQARLMSGRPGGGSVRSTISNTSRASSLESSHSVMTAASVHTDSNASFISQDEVADLNMIETYAGEWKNDKRSGFGVSERSDGLKYEGEWEANKKHGYGATTFRDGSREEGKYKNNVLVTSGRRSKLFILRANKLKDRVENAVAAALRAAQIAHQKADIASSRMASARAKAEQAQQAASKAQSDAEKARVKAREYDPNFFQPGLDILKKEQEHQQQKLAQASGQQNPPIVGNHTSAATAGGGYQATASGLPFGSASTSTNIVENHVPNHHQSAAAIAAATSKAILSRVGLTSPAPDPSSRNSMLGSALAGAAVGSALAFAGGPAAAAIQPRRPGDGNRSMTTAGPPEVVQTSNSRTTTAAGPNASRRPNDSSAGGGSSQSPANVSDPNRLSQLLNPSIIDDHFDQYLVPTVGSSVSSVNLRRPGSDTQRAPAGRDGGLNDEDMMPSFSYDNPDGRDLSPGQGSTQGGFHAPRQLQRRKTLPGGHAQLLIATGVAAAAAAASMAGTGNTPLGNPSPVSTTLSTGGGTSMRPNNSLPVAPTTAIARGGGGGGFGRSAYAGTSRPLVPAAASSLLRSASGPDKGSMPDVSRCAAAAAGPAPAMTREEVHVLSQRRREELRRLREDAERRQQQDIVLRLGDIKDWCQQRQLLVLIIALNVSLATMFFNLLAR